MSVKNEKRIRKVAEAVKVAVAEGQAEAMRGFLESAAAWPLRWRLKLAVGVIFKRYKKRD